MKFLAILLFPLAIDAEDSRESRAGRDSRTAFVKRQGVIRHVLVFLSLFSPLLGRPVFCQTTASVGGIVVTDSGTPVPGVVVTFNNIPPCRRTPSGGLQCDLPAGFPAQTGSDGRFVVTNLLAGEYINLCAQAVQPNQLDSCRWRDFGDAGPRGFTLAEGQTIMDLRLTLRTGTVLKIEVEDRDQFISRGVFFRLSILDSSRIVVSVRQILSGNPAVFATAVPPGATTQLYLETPLVVYDDAGESIPMQYWSLRVSVGSDETVVRLKAVPAIVNAASFWPGPTFGGIASLFGMGLTNVIGIVAADRVPLPTELAGTSVTLGGTRAPLFAVANIDGQEQINFQVPGSGGDIVVTTNGVQKRFFTLGIVNPGIFVNDGQPAIQHGSNFSLVSPANPARRGEAIAIYLTGLYSPPSPQVPLGSPAPAGMFGTCSTLVRIAGINARVLFCGLAPGFVGLNQVNVEVPVDAPSGLADLVIIQNGVPSNTVQLPVE